MRVALIAVLLAVLILWRPLIATLLKRRLARAAAARLPERIRLVPDEPAWRDAARVASIQTELAALGFAWVGDYRVPELPDVPLRLLLRADEAVYANIHEHAPEGVWLELVTPYEDGRRARLTTLATIDAPDPPWIALAVRAPNASPRDAYARLLAERPRERPMPLTPTTLVPFWQDEYARVVAWRKGHSK